MRILRPSHCPQLKTTLKGYLSSLDVQLRALLKMYHSSPSSLFTFCLLPLLPENFVLFFFFFKSLECSLINILLVNLYLSLLPGEPNLGQKSWRRVTAGQSRACSGGIYH